MHLSVCNFKELQFQVAKTETQIKLSQQEVDYSGSNNNFFFPFINHLADWFQFLWIYFFFMSIHQIMHGCFPDVSLVSTVCFGAGYLVHMIMVLLSE